jgi:hypothetical protein
MSKSIRSSFHGKRKSKSQSTAKIKKSNASLRSVTLANHPINWVQGSRHFLVGVFFLAVLKYMLNAKYAVPQLIFFLLPE